MTFQFAATTDKAGSVRKALQDQRDSQLGDLRRAEEEGGATQQPDPDLRDQLEGDLADAGIAAAEAAARKLKDVGSYQVTVSGHRNPDGVQAVSVSVNAVP